MTPLRKLTQLFNRNSNKYHSVTIEEDYDERKQHEKEPALTSERDTGKELHSRAAPTDDASSFVDEDGYSDLNDRIPKRCCSYFGIAMSVAGGFFMACTSLMIKLAQSLPFYEHMAIRGLGLISFSLPIMIYLCQSIILTTKRETGFVYGQAIINCAAMYGLYFAFEHISLADATAIFFINPVWTAILAYFFLRENWSRYDSVALTLSVAGVVLIARPSFLFPTQESPTSSTDTEKVLSYTLSFAGSVGTALTYILVKKSNAKTPALAFLLHYGVVCFVFGLLGGIAPRGLKFPDCETRDNWYALLVAVFAFVGLAFCYYALTIEQAAIVALGRATDIVFVFILEVVFLNVPINGYSLVGSALISLCNAIIVIKRVYAEDG